MNVLIWNLNILVTHQIEGFSIRVYGIMIQVDAMAILNIARDTSFIAAQFRFLNGFMKIGICKQSNDFF